MAIGSGGAGIRGRFVGAIVALAVSALAAPAIAQGDRNAAADAVTPVEEFSQQLDRFKKAIPDLNSKIEESATQIDRWTDIEKSRKEIAELRALVSSALGAVSDNGAVSQLGARALAHAQNKLKALDQDNRFKQEEKQFLTEQWRRLRDETLRANDELAGARKEFAELLRTLQVNEDFIDELIQIRQAAKATDVIRQLARDIRDASTQLKKLIGEIKPPGA
jgi:chromosome segregation ATPase